jgi:hypothetical protein
LEARVIVVEPLGGLGNQLFVYGLGLAVSRRLAVPLVADLIRIKDDPKRQFELSTFRNSLVAARPEIPVPSGPVFHLQRRLRAGGEAVGRYRNFHFETHQGFDRRFLEVPDGSRLRGYFQSWKYLESVANELRNELRDVRSPSPWYEENRRRLSSIDSWVGVHVRLGDYKNWPGMPVAEIYYKRALELLLDLGVRQRIIVFSDEPELARAMPIWASFPDVSFIAGGPNVRPVETMLLMSLAGHLVIANSTFSWWSAWLGATEGRRVVFPRPWGDNLYENRDLVPPDWIGIGREAADSGA